MVIGPSVPAKTIVSPSLIVPFDRMTSIVVPKPSMILTSRMVHSSSPKNIKRSVIRSCVNLTSSLSMSGIPSPEMAEVGTTETVRRKSVFWSKSSVLRPCSEKASLALRHRSSNSEAVDLLCLAKDSRKPPSGVGSHP